MKRFIRLSLAEENKEIIINANAISHCIAGPDATTVWLRSGTAMRVLQTLPIIMARLGV